MQKLSPDFEKRLTALITTMGYELLGYDFAQENRRVVFRIYIDCLGGVSLNDCSAVSRQVGAMLDVDDPFKGKYMLEVSSPGLDRPLFGIEQYKKQLGHRVKVKLHVPIKQRRNFVGVLRRVENGQIYLLLDEGDEITLPFAEIEKGNVIADLDSKKKGCRHE